MTPAEAMEYLAREVRDLQERGKPGRAAKMEEVRGLIFRMNDAAHRAQPPPKPDLESQVTDFLQSIRKGR